MTDEGVTHDAAVEEFDFDAHRDQALAEYARVNGLYSDYARQVHDLIQAALDQAGVKVHSIEHRAKTSESFGSKAARPSESEPQKPRYVTPITEIQDLAGCRVITYFLSDVARVREVVEAEFNVLERRNRSSYLRGGGAPGYESFHYIVDLGAARNSLTEYARYEGKVVEIQVRTILQHAWAEIEHDIQYKSVDELPREIGHRFMELAGLIAISDREFQAISDAHERVMQEADQSISEGRLGDVEITPETLKRLLDQELGSDGRMSAWGYAWTTRLLKGLGFSNLQQVETCLELYDDDRLSRIAHGSRQGQLTRFELVIMAAVGPLIWESKHLWANNPGTPWFQGSADPRFARFENAGIEVGTYTPEPNKPS